MIKVSADPARKAVIVQMSGFLSVEDVEDFARSEQAAVESMGLQSDEFYLLVDTPATIIQPQEVVAAFQRLVENAVYKAGRIAVVRRGFLTTIQAERILMIRPNAAVFPSRKEAEAWLFSEPLEMRQTEAERQNRKSALRG